MIFRNIRYFVLFFAFWVMMPAQSFAQPACDPSNRLGLDFCNCLMYPNGGQPGFRVIAPIFQCFTDTTLVNDTTTTPAKQRPRGIIPNAAYRIFTDSTMFNLFRTIIISMYSLAVLFLGFKIYLGEMREIKKEIFVNLFKLAGVIYFMGQAHNIYLMLLNAMMALSDALVYAGSGVRATFQSIPAYANTAGGQNFWSQCVNPGTPTLPTTTLHMWNLWDCTFNYLIGLSDWTNVLKVSGILTFGLLFSYTLGTGVIIFLLIIYFVGSIISAMLRFLQSFLMAMMAISFLFLIGYLFVPLVLFKQTFSYFQKWLHYIIGAVFTPVLSMAFMLLALVALDVLLFTGKDSLFAKVMYNKALGTGYENLNYTVDQSNSAFVAASALKQNQFLSVGNVSHDNLQQAGCTGKAMHGGIIATVRKSNETGTQTENALPAPNARIGNQFYGLHLVECINPNDTKPEPPGCTPLAPPGTVGAPPENVSGTGIWAQFPGATPQTLYTYISGVLYSVAVACMLAYIINAIMNYLPDLVDGVVSQGTGIGKQIAGAALPGQSAVGGAFGSAFSNVFQNSGKLNAFVRNMFVRPIIK